MAAIGSDATAAGFALVPDTGEEGRVRWGAQEINRTRDYIGQIKELIPVGKAGYRAASGLSSGTTLPADSVGSNGDWFAKII